MLALASVVSTTGDPSGPRQWIALGLVVLGALLSFAAGVGIARFPDALARLHALTKPQVLGLICVLVAIVVDQGSWMVALAVLPALAFQLVIVPVSAHMIGRAAHRSGDYRSDLLVVDDLAAVEEGGTPGTGGPGAGAEHADGYRAPAGGRRPEDGVRREPDDPPDDVDGLLTE